MDRLVSLSTLLQSKNNFKFTSHCLASFLYRYIDRQLCLTFFVLLLAIIQVFLPAYVKLAIMFAMLLVNNIGAGAWDSSTSIWIVDAIPVGNAAFLQGNQMMYGLGSASNCFVKLNFNFI